MSTHDDDGGERYGSQMNETDIDSLLRGQAPGTGDLADLAAFVDDLHRVASGPPPVPLPALAEFMTTGSSATTVAPAAAVGTTRWGEIRMKASSFVAGLSLAAKVGLGAGIAMAMGAAGTTGVLITQTASNSQPHSEPTGPTATLPTIPTTTVAPTGGHTGPGDTTGGSTTTTTPETHPTTTAPETHPTTTTPAPQPTTTEPKPPTTEPTGPTTTEAQVPHTISITCGPAGTTIGVTCTWTDPPAGATGFALLRTTASGPGRAPLTTSNMATRTFTDTSTTANTTYGYRIDALNPNGTVAAASSVVMVTTNPAPTSHEPTTPSTTVPPTTHPTTGSTTPPTTGGTTQH